jgi:hypothetical protein
MRTPPATEEVDLPVRPVPAAHPAPAKATGKLTTCRSHHPELDKTVASIISSFSHADSPLAIHTDGHVMGLSTENCNGPRLSVSSILPTLDSRLIYEYIEFRLEHQRGAKGEATHLSGSCIRGPSSAEQSHERQ